MAHYLITLPGGDTKTIDAKLVPARPDLKEVEPPLWLLSERGYDKPENVELREGIYGRAKADYNAKRAVAHATRCCNDAWAVYCDANRNWRTRKGVKVQYVPGDPPKAAKPSPAESTPAAQPEEPKVSTSRKAA